jgi:hypothetical protein
MDEAPPPQPAYPRRKPRRFLHATEEIYVSKEAVQALGVARGVCQIWRVGTCHKGSRCTKSHDLTGGEADAVRLPHMSRCLAQVYAYIYIYIFPEQRTQDEEGFLLVFYGIRLVWQDCTSSA